MSRIGRLGVIVLAILVAAGVPPAARAAGEVVANDLALGDLLASFPIGMTLHATSQFGEPSFELGDPAHGTLEISIPKQCMGIGPIDCDLGVYYTPDNPGFLGADGFEFTATAGDNSDTGSVTFNVVDDTTPPTCDFGIFGKTMGHDRATDTLAVDARLITGDTQSGQKSVRLSNTGTTAAGMLTTYEEHALTNGWEVFDWSLTNGTGGSSTVGLHTVYAQCSDNFDNWTTVRSATIRYDPLDPVVSTPTVTLTPTAPFSGILARIAYSVTDPGGSGGYGYEVARSIDGKPWQSIGVGGLSRPLDFGVSGGHSYRYRIRAADDAGNIGPWAYTRTFTPVKYGESSAAIKRAGTWNRVWYYDVGFYTRYSRQAGATARLTFTGRTVGWVAITGPGRGKARIYLDGALVQTVDTLGSSNDVRVKFQKTWASSGTHTITVKVVGTTGRPRVELKEFVVLR